MKPPIGNPAPGTAPRHRIPSDPAAGTAPTTQPDTLRGNPTLSLIGFLVVEMVIGYEWFISGLVKFMRGDFPAGLADELLKMSAGTTDWYGRFLGVDLHRLHRDAHVRSRRSRRAWWS